MDARIEREKKLYNEGIDRSKYVVALGHAQSGYPRDRRMQRVRLFMEKSCKSKDILEIGSTTWNNWINIEKFAPKTLTCINISENELEKGVCLYKKAVCKIPEHKFLIMDAHHLDFADKSFDVIFGSDILHHLSFEIAIKEIHRVLRQDGVIIFSEPLGMNPVARFVRKRTPNARTIDEKPLEKEEIKILKKYFHLDNSYFQLFHVPAGVLSKFLFKSPYNPLTFLADCIDRSLEYFFKVLFSPPLLFYRSILIYGIRRG